jgi:uncharacterized protein HemX
MDIQNQTPQTSPEEEVAPIEGSVFKEKESKVGPIIGSIIIILIIIIGGIYFWSTQVEVQRSENEQENEMLKDEPLASPEEYDPISAATQIEAEVDAIDFDEIDAELEAIEAEFSS